MALGVVCIWSTSLHLLVQICLNTCNCSTISLYFSLARNQNKYLDQYLPYLALPDWKFHLLILLERMTAKQPVFQHCLSRNWKVFMYLLDSWHSSPIYSLSCHLLVYVSFTFQSLLYSNIEANRNDCTSVSQGEKGVGINPKQSIQLFQMPDTKRS